MTATTETTELQSHAAAGIFPLMTADEFAALKANIEEYGQRDEIVLRDGRILDGRNRYQACRELGIEPQFREIDDEDLDPVAYVISVNLHRRHLSRAERDAVMQKLRDEGRTLQAIAGAVGVDTETVRRRTTTSANAKVAGADGKSRPARYEKRKREPEPVADDEDEDFVQYPGADEDCAVSSAHGLVGASGSVVARPLEKWTMCMREHARLAQWECQTIVADDKGLPEDVRQSLWDMLEDLAADIRSN